MMDENLSGVIENQESDSLESVDDIAALLDGEGQGEEQEEDEGTEELSSEEEQQPAEEAQEEEGERPESEAVEAPEGWEGEVFKTLPSEAQKLVVEREREHAEAISSKIAERDQAVQAKAQYEQAVSSELATALKIVQDVVNGEFAGVDWLKLQREDPQTFLALDAERKMRMAGVQQLHQNAIKAQQYAQEQAAQRSEVELKTEFEKSITLSPVSCETPGFRGRSGSAAWPRDRRADQAPVPQQYQRRLPGCWQPCGTWGRCGTRGACRHSSPPRSIRECP
jgi:hypothetical protein